MKQSGDFDLLLFDYSEKDEAARPTHFQVNSDAFFDYTPYGTIVHLQ